jgi:NTP pyrophosphatase (non-canonical NTP hydrolase)
MTNHHAIHTAILANKAEANLYKWGMQPLETLGLVASEECGELCQAMLQARHEGGDADRIRQEAIDLGAVCLQILAHFK